MLFYRRLLVVAILVATVFGLARAAGPDASPVGGAAAAPGAGGPAESVAPEPVHSGDRPVRIQTIEDAETVSDPRALERAGDVYRERGDLVLARALYEKAVGANELTVYLRYSADLREALVLEHLGELDAAEARYRTAADKDILYTVLVLRIASHHPKRDALVEELVGRVRAMGEAVKNGAKDQVIYVTKKGEPRYLEHVENEDVLPRLRAVAAGDESKKLRYCYIDELDLTGVDPATLPHRMQFGQCVIGKVRIPDLDVGQLVISGFVLGDFDVGKTWEGAVNQSKAFPGSRFEEITTRETVFLGRANFQDITISGRKAAFPLSVFEGVADFRGARFGAPADFRFSVFGEGANFKRARVEKMAYFGSARFRKATTFTGLFAEREVYFNSVRFEGPVHFDGCEWRRLATFEDGRFDGPVTWSATRVGGRLNLSRSVFADSLDMKEVFLGGMDLIGADLQGDARFVDARFDGKVRFSLDDVTRARYLDDASPLLSLYRDYQGDEDAEDPLATGASYGVEHVDDLIAKVQGNLSFANSVFGGFVIFERVAFGLPGKDTTAEFYNTQFGGETHFERTTWHSSADFTTIYAQEVALNEATFHRTLVLDDANVPGRVTLTDARFTGGATLSFYGAEIGTFQVDRAQVEGEGDGERLYYEGCAGGDGPLPPDLRLLRDYRGAPPPDDEIRAVCHARAIDEFVSLKQSFGDRAMTGDEDWAYWWIKHHETTFGARYGGLLDKVAWPVRFLLFELAFGWGVRLGNLGVTALIVCLAFMVIYKAFCADTVMSYNGDNVAIRDIPWIGMFYISLQSLGAFNTGWDFGESDPRFRYLNTAHTFMGVIIMTFFVGAYTRMILA
ncbi:MAG: hypothetical protein Q8P41_31120 [Pseudomonadota bacterium]|nr:hypothetical protein [Pseudomonadota bacterium]